MTRTVTLSEFMPYGAPELQSVARPYTLRALLVSSALSTLLFAAFGLLRGVVGDLAVAPPPSVIIIDAVPAPPSLAPVAPLPPVAPAGLRAATAGIAVPVPDDQVPIERTIASADELRTAQPGVGAGDAPFVVEQPATAETLPGVGRSEAGQWSNRGPVQHRDRAFPQVEISDRHFSLEKTDAQIGQVGARGFPGFCFETLHRCVQVLGRSGLEISGGVNAEAVVYGVHDHPVKNVNIQSARATADRMQDFVGVVPMRKIDAVALVVGDDVSGADPAGAWPGIGREDDVADFLIALRKARAGQFPLDRIHDVARHRQERIAVRLPGGGKRAAIDREGQIGGRIGDGRGRRD